MPQSTQNPKNVAKTDENNQIYNNFDATTDATCRYLGFRAGKVIASAEMNAVQAIAHHKSKLINDVLFQTGDVVRDAQAVLSPTGDTTGDLTGDSAGEPTGELTIEAGDVYLDGDIYHVEKFERAIATAGIVTIGVWLQKCYVTEIDNPRLLNPAVGTRGENEAGAWQIHIDAVWGLATDSVDGDFYAVYTAKDGYLSAKEPPPQVNALTQAIAKYDKDSTGSQYIISGLQVHVASDIDGLQQYVIDAGRARIGGYAIEYPTARRFSFAPQPSIATVDNEPHLAVASPQRINTNRSPIAKIKSVSITSQKTVDIVHDNFSNSQDTLPDASVVAIISVSQAGVSYEAGVDYQLITGKIDWSFSGAEPASGSTYQVTYNHIITQEPDSSDSTGLVVSGAVANTQILISYEHYLKRIDRICLDYEGEPHLLRGIASVDNHLPPKVPNNLMLLSTILQDFIDVSQRVIIADGDRLVTMANLNNYGSRLDYLSEMLAQTRLEQSANMSESGAKRGIFADPFLSNQFRDAGVVQTALIDNGKLVLPLAARSTFFRLDKVYTLDFSTSVVLAQNIYTQCMKINPYMAFDPLPAQVTLSPAVDRWTVTNNTTDEVVNVSVLGTGAIYKDTVSDSVTVTTESAQYLRTIDIEVSVAGFGNAELVDKVTFDGQAVIPHGQIQADITGNAVFSITIPENTPAGYKSVIVAGAGGTTGEALFIGEGTIVNSHTSRTITRQYYDPLAQTFTLMNGAQIAAIDLHICEKGNHPIVLQIRETQVGIPNQTVLAQTQLSADMITTGAKNRFNFDFPVFLEANTEYAIVVISDEATPAVGVASLGDFDAITQRWVTSQPYTVGVLLSSSNASTWTPHNDKDLCFDLLAASYSATSKDIVIGEMLLENVTDIAVMFDSEIISADTQVALNVLLEDGSKYHLSDGQAIALPKAINQSAKLSATLVGSADFSPILREDIQVITANIASSADYVSRAIAAGSNSRVRVLVDAFLPAGSGLVVSASAAGSAEWQTLSAHGNRQLDTSKHELTFENTTLIDATAIQVKLELSGSASARCYLENLRILVIEA